MLHNTPFLQDFMARYNYPEEAVSLFTEVLDKLDSNKSYARLELNFEGHLWFDLDRTGGSVSYTDANITRNIEPTSKFWALPIPKLQVDINENLKQNPGYGN